jgi:hypothetical protein
MCLAKVSPLNLGVEGEFHAISLRERLVPNAVALPSAKGCNDVDHVGSVERAGFDGVL